MRGPGEIRQAMRRAAEPFADVGATWRQLGEAACVGTQAARRTFENMVRAGDLLVLGTRRVEGACRPMLVAVPAPARPSTSAEPVCVAVSCWADFK